MLVHAFHSGEIAADNALRCLHHPLEGLVIRRGADANAAREDALYGAPAEVSWLVFADMPNFTLS